MAAELPEDFVDLLIALLEVGAEFLVVGGYAVAHYGHPRATKDIDIWVRTGQPNANLVIRRGGVASNWETAAIVLHSFP